MLLGLQAFSLGHCSCPFPPQSVPSRLTANCLPSALVCGPWRSRAQYCHPLGLESLICSPGEGTGQCEKLWEEFGRAVCLAEEDDLDRRLL